MKLWLIFKLRKFANNSHLDKIDSQENTNLNKITQ